MAKKKRDRWDPRALEIVRRLFPDRTIPISEIVEKLKAEGITKKNGSAYGPPDISVMAIRRLKLPARAVRANKRGRQVRLLKMAGQMTPEAQLVLGDTLKPMTTRSMAQVGHLMVSVLTANDLPEQHKREICKLLAEGI